MYDSKSKEIGFFYNDTQLEIETDESLLSIDETYKINIKQERLSNGDYVLSVEKSGTKIYNEYILTPVLLPSARVYFSNDHITSLAADAIIENVSIIKGNLTLKRGGWIKLKDFQKLSM